MNIKKQKPVIGVFCLLFTLLFVVALWDYRPDQSAYITTHPTTNAVGVLGVLAAFWSIHWLGVWVCFLPVLLIQGGYKYFFKKESNLRYTQIIASALFLFLSSTLTYLIEGARSRTFDVNHHYWSGGASGVIGSGVVTVFLEKILGNVGSILLVGVSTFVAFYYVFLSQFKFGLINARAKLALEKLKSYLRFHKKEWLINRAQKKLEKITLKKEEELKKEIATEQAPAPSPIEVKPPQQEEVKQPAPSVEIAKVIDSPAKVKAKSQAETKIKEELKPSAAPIRVIQEEQVERVQPITPETKGEYKFPSLDLLMDSDGRVTCSVEEHEQTAQALIDTLNQFGIEVTPSEVHAGPVITRYEVIPAPGVRVERIVNLDKNIAMALRATSVRVIAPVPGKGCVGIEVPNQDPACVSLREIIESKDWVDSEADIPLVLGKEVTGKPMIADLARMPHLLIAGSTGSGKTVCINSIIASLLYHSSPEDVRFIMIDPKIVEMQVYNTLPHMLIPVVTDPNKVPSALKWLIKEMEYRYQVFAKVGVRNIAGFNAKILKKKSEEARAKDLDAALSAEERAAASLLELEEEDVDLPGKKLPYIVCIVDELADLMMVAPADIETGIARLAQLARAAGIHLIIATQRPSVNVITGVIKANLPSRIAFKVASKVDSRTILDGQGADALIGRGDMLFIPPGLGYTVRAQGAFVSDEEINSIVESLKVNGPPQYCQSIQDELEGNGTSSNGASGQWEDELVPQAIELIQANKKASTSFLQRKLRIGYNRAARMMDMLEDEGYIGPDNGSSPRDILIEN